MSEDQDRVEAARKKLEAAIETYFEESGWNESGVLTTWMLIGHQLSTDDEGFDVDTYPIMYRNGTVADHVARGLLSSALHRVNRTEWKRVED